MKCIKRFFVMAICICMTLIAIGGRSIESMAMPTPRLIVTGYDTNPGTVKAGDEFEMTIHLKNTSKRTAVSNIKLTLSSADNEFISATGSATIYIDKIDVEEEKDIRVKLKARGDLAQKPYVLTVSTVYEDRYESSYEENTNLSIPVIQELRVSVTDVAASPDIAAVGEKTNISFSINNQSKNKMYNVNVTIKENGVEETNTFIGNIESGMTGYFDAMVKCEAVNEGSVKAIISYEDSEGNVDEVTQKIDLEIIEKMEEPEVITGIGAAEPADSSPNMAGIGAVIAVVIFVIVIVVKRKHRKDDEDEIS